MKKKIDKTIVLKDSDLSRAHASILEANQTQQAVILRFARTDELSKYSLVICKISPLLNSPEKVEKVLANFKEIEIIEDQKVYIIFNNGTDEVSKDDEGNLLLRVRINKPFEIKNDQAIALLETGNENELKIIDWAKPIIDEVIPLETIEKLKDYSGERKTDHNPDFYKKKSTTENQVLISKFSNIFDKPNFWIIFFIGLVSIFSFISSIPIKDPPIKIIFRTLLILISNSILTFTVYKWALSDKKYSAKFFILYSIIIILIGMNIYFIDFYTTILDMVILGGITFIFSIKVQKK